MSSFSKTVRSFYILTALAVVLLLTLVVATALLPGLARAATGSISLNSGAGSTQYSVDNGATWQGAFNVSDPAWASAISGTSWVYCSSTKTNSCGLGTSTVGKVTQYRVAFNLPASFSAPSLTMQLHADNSAQVFVNGNLIATLACYGQSEGACNSAGNFNGAPESASTSNASFFQAGVNYLQINVWDVGGISGTDYSASVSYTYDTPPVLTVGGSVTYTEDAPPVVVAPGLTLIDLENDNIGSAKATIGSGFNAAQDSLGIQGALPAGISSSYNSSTGVLTLTGSASPAAYQQALRQVTYSNNSQNPSTAPRTVTFNIGSQLAFTSNGHFYEFVAGYITWANAQAAAQTKTLYGLQGYLATITSASENTFIKDKLAGNGWLGGSDAAVEGTWRWVTGPEAGTVFCIGTGNCVPQAGAYTNWDAGEPNQAGEEDHVHMLGNPGFGSRVGKWNDLSGSYPQNGGLYQPLGYVVEYGGMPGDPALQLSGNATVNVVAVNDPPTASAGGPYSVNEGSSISLFGTGSDIDGAIVSYAWDLDNNGSFETVGQNVTFNGLDGLVPAVGQTVKLRVCDNGTGTPGPQCSVATTTVTMNNVAPSLAIAGSNTAYWVDWTSADLSGGTASGVITLPDASTINVTLQSSNCSGSDCALFSTTQTSGGTNYWIPSTPYTSPQVPNGPPDSDVIALKGGSATVYTVTFSQPIVDPIMAILSLGQPTVYIDYDFNAPFTIVSQGAGYFTPPGCTTCVLQNLAGDVLRGNEGHGTIKFLGTYSSFSWTVPNPEIWHGFTFAVRSSQALAQTVIVNEGQTATNNGTWSDPGFNGDGVNVSASVGSATTNANGTWNWSFNTSDGPAQSQIVTITATDKDGASTSKTFPLVVNNVAPTITNVFQVAPIPEGSVSVSGNIVAQATDPAGSNDPLTFTFDCDNNGSYETPAIPSTSAADCFFDDNGSYTVGVQVSDGDGGVDTATVTAVVTNVAPTAFLPNSPSINEGSSATFTFTNQFDPSNADTVAGFHYSFACDGNVASLATTYAGAGISDSVSCSYADNGTYTVAGRIFDKDNGYNTYTASVNVLNVPPVVNAGADATINEGGTFTGSGFFTDPGADTWTGTVDYGDGSGTIPLALNPDKTFSLSHVYADEGVYNVQVCVKDKDNGQGCDIAQVTVNNVAPQITSLVVTPNPVDENGTVTLSGTFTDPGVLDAHTVIINWGPGQGGVTAINLAAGVLTFSATHQYKDDGASPGNGTAADVYPVNVTVADYDGGTDASTTSVTVNNVAPAITSLTVTSPISENGTATLTGAFTDPGTLDIHTVYIDWGDGSPAESMVLPQGARGFSKNHQYLDDNPTGTLSDNYVIHVKVGDDDTGADAEDVTITVNNVAPVVNAGPDVTINENGIFNSSGSFTDVGTLDTHTATVDYGDGTGVQALALSSGSFSLSHQYLDDNPTATPSDTYTVTVCVTDDDSGTTCDSATVTVNNVAPVITSLAVTSPINENDTATLTGAFTDPGTLDIHTVYIDWGDGSPAESVVLPLGARSFSKTHQYLDDNPTGTPSDNYVIHVKVGDDDTGADAKDVTVTVNNVAPAVNAGADQTLTFGSPVSISATFTDPGTQDTWTYSIDWGDGTPMQSGSATPSAPVTGTHQYVVPGNQTITVCVSDDDLGKNCDSVAITFVSTTGKITGGTLRFGNNGRGGFNVQSDDGVTVKGELEYQNGSVNLHAHTMTAIAVSPDLTKGWFAGVLEDGRVFVAYVEDNGEPGKNDVFKLWVNGVLQNGDGKLTGGNIQIHKK